MPEANAGLFGPVSVTVTAGSLRPERSVTTIAHRWTTGGVAVETEFTGGHLMHLAVAGCVLNDLYREAAGLELSLDGVRVTATGSFDTSTWASAGIDYEVEIDAAAEPGQLAGLIARVDEVAEIPRAIRQGADVRRVPAG